MCGYLTKDLSAFGVWAIFIGRLVRTENNKTRLFMVLRSCTHCTLLLLPDRHLTADLRTVKVSCSYLVCGLFITPRRKALFEKQDRRLTDNFIAIKPFQDYPWTNPLSLSGPFLFTHSDLIYWKYIKVAQFKAAVMACSGSIWSQFEIEVRRPI